MSTATALNYSQQYSQEEWLPKNSLLSKESTRSGGYQVVLLGDGECALYEQMHEVSQHYWQPFSRIQQTFVYLAESWKKDTCLLSSLSQKTNDPSYQRIIAMGQHAVPLILAELIREPDYWFTALSAITGEDPISPNDWGDLDAMSQAWVTWGKRRGLI